MVVSTELYRKFESAQPYEGKEKRGPAIFVCPNCEGHGHYRVGADNRIMSCWLCKGSGHLKMRKAITLVSLTAEEYALVELLTTAEINFAKLEVLHADDYLDFVSAVHTLKKIIFARPQMRTQDTQEFDSEAVNMALTLRTDEEGS